MAPSSKHVRRLATVGAVLAAAVATLAAVSPSQAQRTTPPVPATTSATLTWNSSAVRVKVDSSRPACERGRRVLIAFPFQDAILAATDKTSAQGVVRITEEGIPYAKSFAYVLRTAECHQAQSNVVENPATRAAAKARTSARLIQTETGFRVKVSSPVAKCVKNRRVDLFGYAPGEPFAEGATGFTNGDGVFRYPPAGGAGAPSNYRIVAFVRTAAGCNVGQSNELRPVGP